MSHTITITRLPGDEGDDADYEIGGDCEPGCLVWKECKRAACKRMNNIYPPFDERYRHGVEHQFIEGEWMVETNMCGLQYAYDLALEAADIPELGTYKLVVDWDGDHWLASIAAELTKEPSDVLG
jgi:hypothetical protein